jgi:hypothetical protein
MIGRRGRRLERLPRPASGATTTIVECKDTQGDAVEKMVSGDPGPEYLPPKKDEDAAPSDGEHPVTGSLEAHADDPETRAPLDHPQELVGERPATGSNDSPG